MIVPEKVTETRADCRQVLKLLRYVAAVDRSPGAIDIRPVCHRQADRRCRRCFRSLAEPWADTGTSPDRFFCCRLWCSCRYFEDDGGSVGSNFRHRLVFAGVELAGIEPHSHHRISAVARRVRLQRRDGFVARVVQHFDIAARAASEGGAEIAQFVADEVPAPDRCAKDRREDAADPGIGDLICRDPLKQKPASPGV